MKTAELSLLFAVIACSTGQAKTLAAIGVVPNVFDDSAPVSVAYEYKSPTLRQNAVVLLTVRDGVKPDSAVLHTETKVASFPPGTTVRVSFGPVDAIGRKASSTKMMFSATVLTGPDQVGLPLSAATLVRTKVCKAAGGSRDSKVRQICTWQTFRDPKIVGNPPIANPLP